MWWCGFVDRGSSTTPTLCWYEIARISRWAAVVAAAAGNTGFNRAGRRLPLEGEPLQLFMVEWELVDWTPGDVLGTLATRDSRGLGFRGQYVGLTSGSGQDLGLESGVQAFGQFMHDCAMDPSHVGYGCAARLC